MVEDKRNEEWEDSKEVDYIEERENKLKLKGKKCSSCEIELQFREKIYFRRRNNKSDEKLQCEPANKYRFSRAEKIILFFNAGLGYFLKTFIFYFNFHNPFIASKNSLSLRK